MDVNDNIEQHKFSKNNAEVARAAQKKSAARRRENRTISKAIQNILDCHSTNERMTEAARAAGIISKYSTPRYRDIMALAQVIAACDGDSKAFENVCKYCGEYSGDNSVIETNADAVKDLAEALKARHVDGAEDVEKDNCEDENKD